MDFQSIGLLILRIGFAGIMAVRHGLPKLLAFTDKMHHFRDPLGISSTLSLTLTVCAEFFCAILVVLGLFTRLASFPVAFAMAVAFFVVHASDPFAKKEMAMLFMLAFSTLFCTGGGKYSLDAFIRGKY